MPDIRREIILYRETGYHLVENGMNVHGCEHVAKVKKKETFIWIPA